MSAPKCPFITVPSEFKIDQVSFDQFQFGKQLKQKPVGAPEPVPAPPLGVLGNFAGTFHGNGFNIIFRPNSGPTPTTFPNPITPPPPTPPSEQLLELNLTKETLVFSNSLGNIPNRGVGLQGDIFLNGVPYLQSIEDVTNMETGKDDGAATAIHFETGLWMHVPETTVNPKLGTSLVRMASIPHGTTVNAQCLEPTKTFQGPPIFDQVDITPFIIGTEPPSKIRFAAQTASDVSTPRLPQDLTKFIAAGTITQDILDDPNTILRNAIKGQNIVETIVFTVSTTPTAPELGGGAANITFLLGDSTGATPNAFAKAMSSTFWIETVEYQIQVPTWRHGHAPLKISPVSKEGHPVPVFIVEPPHDIHSPKTITVRSTQIQYSQLVLLDFSGLTWPHHSVATLVPSAGIPVPASAWK